MTDRVFEMLVQYRMRFHVDVPNEPTWPPAVLNDPTRFEQLLERSINDGVDRLTEAYGKGWNELNPVNVY